MGTSPTQFATRTALSLVAFTSVAFAQEPSVWIVDAAGTGDFTEISDALAVTQAGWTVLVRPGVYDSPVTLTDQSCSIIAYGTQPVVLTAPVVIENLSNGTNVVLSGLELERGFTIRNCAGPVLLQKCSTTSPALGIEIPPGVPIDDWWFCGVGTSRHKIQNSQRVTLVDCEIRGATGGLSIQDPLPGQHALEVENSSVALYHCNLVGGDGAHGTNVFYATPGGAGGDGIHSEDAFSKFRIHESVLEGGTGGIGADEFVPNGCDGIPTRHPDATQIVPSTYETMGFSAPPIMVGGQSAPLQVDGVPGTPVYLITSLEAHWRTFPANVGILHLASPLNIQSLGVIPANGQLLSSYSPTGPQMGNGFVSVHMQVFALGGGGRFLSEPQRSVVVDPGL